MSGETIITVVGNLTGEPELRFTQTGTASASFTIASTPRMFDRQANEWRDGDALYLRCAVFGKQAENAAESLAKGSRVIAQGRLVQRSFETREGEKRSVIELKIDSIGPELTFATARPVKQHRGTSTSSSAVTDDPWATGGAGDDAAPF